MSHCGLVGLMKLYPVHILNVPWNLLNRSRNVPSPTAAARTPSASCLGGRSLILRSLRSAASGSANIIHVIVSCCALLLLVLVSELGSVVAVCLVRNHSVGQTVPWLPSCGHFFSSPALGLLLAWRTPLSRFLRSTNRANSTLTEFGTNRRPPLSLFQ
jgi:hypothetical protein